MCISGEEIQVNAKTSGILLPSEEGESLVWTNGHPEGSVPATEAGDGVKNTRISSNTDVERLVTSANNRISF